MTNLINRDKSLIWHPYTQEKTAHPVRAITHGKGAYIYDEAGNAILDLISSWWCNVHGHANPEIANALHQQALTLEHVIFAGFTHEPAVTLCEMLKRHLHTDFAKFFFSDNGSTATEIAAKMAYQYFRNKGENRQLFLTFEGDYHGDTFGAMSFSAESGFHDHFRDLFFKVISVPFPETWHGDEGVAEREHTALVALADVLEKYGQNIAAMMIEPLVQGAVGMRVCRPEFLKKALEMVRSYGILVIFDEVMTGFYRTGTMFAYQQIGFTPDFICLSKALTGGFLPLALTITTQDIYDAFLSDQSGYAFCHGHTYYGNPLACAAAIKSLELLESDSCQQQIKAINSAHYAGIELLQQQVPQLEKPRVIGNISAFCHKSSAENTNDIKNTFLERGMLIRPLGSTIYLLPPYCITTDELLACYQKIATILTHK